jgi:short-subunit dehydrogenase
MTMNLRSFEHAIDGGRAEQPFAIVTGASISIGLELAKQCAAHGFNLLMVADEQEVKQAAASVEHPKITVRGLQADLATIAGIERLLDAARGRPVDALLVNAGRDLGRAFLDQDFDDVRQVIDANVTGTVYLLQKVGRQMRSLGRGRILITGSIADFMPGAYQAVHNGTRAFLDAFSFALRAELKDSGITVTCLMPGATEADFFEGTGMMDAKAGQARKGDPADVAKTGFEAMMRGDGVVVSGRQNTLQSEHIRAAAASGNLGV